MLSNKHIYLTTNPQQLNDPFFRYKIDLPIISYVSKKGAVLTIFENVSQISKQLYINETTIIKLIGKILSVKTYENQFTCKIEKVEIENVLIKIIQKYMLCKKCDLPELDFLVVKGKHSSIKTRCKACGFKEKYPVISKIDQVFVSFYDITLPSK
jgi:translation initiation factor 2 beta subunit (eIF-2beta)/eIF-5